MGFNSAFKGLITTVSKEQISAVRFLLPHLKYVKAIGEGRRLL